MPARALTELLRGQGAHADPVACVEDISADLAARHVTGFPHCIADLVFHMNYWMDYELRRIRGQRPTFPEHNSESFPAALQAASNSDWDELRQRFAGLISDFATLANSPGEELQRQVEIVQRGEKKVAGTLEAVITQMVAHNSYHTGQIAMIRRMLNARPPRAGGDTW